MTTEPRIEYVVDRLRAEVRQLENKITDMCLERNLERDRALIAEIVLCVLCGVIGYGLGVWLK